MARANTANRSVEAEFRSLHNQVAELGDQLGSLLAKAKADGSEAAEAELSLLQEKLNGLLTDAKDKGQEAWNKVEDTVRERPGTSLVTAFAAGAILAGLLLRR